MSIKVGFCVAYDWEMLRHSLPLVYDHADTICVSLDANRVSWAGEKFDFDENQFQSFIGSIDSQRKIQVLEENFFKPDLSPMQNEVHQRNRMADFLGKGGWHIQLDCDEYFVEFESFIKSLSELGNNGGRLTNICCELITLFKKVNNGYLIIDRINKDNIEMIAIASTEPQYQYGRRNGYFNYYTAFNILHQSWARSESDILMKVKNWGHKNDFDTNKFIEFWKDLDETNFHRAINFHPINPQQWPSLRFVPGHSVEELLSHATDIQVLPLSKFELWMKNSRWLAKVKYAWHQLTLRVSW